jgi:hypothetical protein
MAFNTRIFLHDGIDQLPVTRPTQYAADSVHVLRQPYLYSETLSVSAAAVASAPVADARVNVLRVEVPDGQTVRYEINPPGAARVAGIDSPSLSGKDQFYFRDGWSISLVDASGLA